MPKKKNKKKRKLKIDKSDLLGTDGLQSPLNNLYAKADKLKKPQTPDIEIGSDSIEPYKGEVTNGL